MKNHLALTTRDAEVLSPPTDTGHRARELSFARLYRAHARSVAHALAGRGVPPAEIDDAIQEVFLVLHERFESLDGHGKLGSWLRGVAFRVAQNRVRARRRRAWEECSVEPDDLDWRHASSHQGASPEDRLVQREWWERILSVLDDLDTKMREAWVDSVVRGLTAEEIGRSSATSSNTVLSRIRAARARLARLLPSAEGLGISCPPRGLARGTG